MEDPRFYISKNFPDDAKAAGLYLLWASYSRVIIVLIIRILIISRKPDFTFLTEERINFMVFCLFGYSCVLVLKKKEEDSSAGTRL